MNINERNQLFPLGDGLAQLYASVNQKPGAASAEVLCAYDCATQRLSARNYKNAPSQLTNYAVTEFCGCIYIIGGIYENSRPSRDVYALRGGVFAVLRDALPYALYDAAAAASGEFLAVFGGRTGTKVAGNLLLCGPDLAFEALPAAHPGQIFDLHAKNELGPWPEARSQAAMASCHGSFYLFGGCGVATLRDLWRLDISPGASRRARWTLLTQKIGPQPTANSALLSYNNTLFLFDLKHGEVWRYGRSWEPRGPCSAIGARGWWYDGDCLWYPGGFFQVGCW